MEDEERQRNRDEGSLEETGSVIGEGLETPQAPW